MRLDVRSDINAILRKHDDMRDEILKAAAAALNETARDVRKEAIQEISTRYPDYSKRNLQGYVTIRKAKFRKHKTTKAGSLRVNYGGVSASVIVSGKAPNLIYFVVGPKRPGATRNASGVTAKVNGRNVLYDRTFMVKNKQTGKVVVVSRGAYARRDHGKWQPGWSKGKYGPALPKLAATRTTIEAMDAIARIKWPAYWKARLNGVIGGDE